jgi:pyrroloquinoline quinone biosynthesis protein D
MSEAPKAWVPRLAPGCRFAAGEGQQDLLLIPERALRLRGPARTILELCDGERAVGEIIEELKRRYSSQEGARIENEAVDFLIRMRDRGVLEGL